MYHVLRCADFTGAVCIICHCAAGWKFDECDPIYPAGLLLVGFLGDRWKRYGKILLILVICCLLSLGIEHLQYHLGIGLAETDDVLHNSLGGVIGAISSWMPAACKYGK